MLTYNDQYQILAGVYYTFNLKKNSSNNSSTPLLRVKHSTEKIERMKVFYSYNKYNTTTKHNFIIYCLYTALNNNLTSLHSMMEIMSSYTKDDIKIIIEFKNRIINYKLSIAKDISLILDRYNGKTPFENIIKMYRRKEINWFTMYYYGLYNDINFEGIRKSRRYKGLISKIEKLMLYISFRDSTLECIKDSFKKESLI